MSVYSLSGMWCQVLALLGLEVGLIALGVALAQRWAKRAAWRRTFCQAGLVAALVVAGCELSGVARVVAGWGATAIKRPQAKAAMATEERQKSEIREPTSEDSSKLRVQMRTLGPDAAAHDQPASPGVSGPAPRGTHGVSDAAVVLGICLVWGVGAAVVGGRAGGVRCLFVLFRLRCRAVKDPELLRRLGTLAGALRVPRRVGAIESPRLTDAVAFGFIQPTVGLPLGFGARFGPAKQEVMLAHELAHLAAHDPFWCGVADAAAAVLWWHPAVWWLRRRLHLASEMAADEASLLVADGPRVLAECLVELGVRALEPRFGQLSASGFRSHLGRRVQRLVGLKGAWGPGPSGFRATLARTLGAIGLVAIVIGCTAWAAPQTLTKGNSMKMMKQNWKRSLATFALLATVKGSDATLVAAQSNEHAVAAKPLQAAMGLGDGSDAYPDAPMGSRARLDAARAMYDQGQAGNAMKLLKRLVETDPFGREAPEALSLLAKSAVKSGSRPDEARQWLTRLCTDYYPFDPLVSEARKEIGFEPLSPRQMILLDASLQESSIYDRDLEGSYNFGQYEVLQALIRRGFKVHCNERQRQLVPSQMACYGLIVMNGRYGGTDEPPMTAGTIEACEAYVSQGGNLLIVASGEHLGEGKEHLFYNPLLERFGMKFRSSADIPWGRNPCVVTEHPALRGIKGFTAYGGVRVDAGNKGEVLGEYEGQPIIVAMPYGKGRVVAAGLGAGLLGCCMNPSRNNDREGDIEKNAALLSRLAAYLLSNAPANAPDLGQQAVRNRQHKQFQLPGQFRLSGRFPKKTDRCAGFPS